MYHDILECVSRFDILPFCCMSFSEETTKNFVVLTMKLLTAATKNKSRLEFRRFLVENTAAYFSPLLQTEPNGNAKNCCAKTGNYY